MKDSSKTKHELVAKPSILKKKIKKQKKSESQQKSTEIKLGKSKHKYHHLVENMPSLICTFFPDSTLTYVNKAYCDFFQKRPDELIGKKFLNFLPDKVTRNYVRSQYMSLTPENPSITYEHEIIAPDGTDQCYWHRWTDRAFFNKNRRISYFQSIGQDITEHKRTLETMIENENRYRLLADNATDVIWVIGLDMRPSYISPSIMKLLGYTVEEAIARTMQQVFTPDSFEKAMQIFAKEMEIERTGQGNPVRSLLVELELVRKDGSTIPVEGNYRFLRDETGKANSILAIIRDITDRKVAEKELHKRRRQLADIIDFLPDATLVIDKEGKVIAWNRAMESMSGVKKEDMLGKGDYEYTLPFYGVRRPALIDLALNPDKEIEKQYTPVQRMGDVLFGETFTPNLPCGNIHVSATASVLRDNNGEIIAAIECIRDNTERKKLEEQLNRAQKMEALGTLAGGVAHDLNNVLGVLAGYSELLVEMLPEDSAPRRYADNIFKSGIRAAAIIQDLLALARRGVTVSEVVDLNKIVSDYLKTPEFEKLKFYHPHVIISTELEDGLLNIKGSPVHLGKTIMNLVSNAAEAISELGKVTVRTENRYLDLPIKGYDEMKEGDYVVLMVSDTGTGISPNDVEKIFEPFYTKKAMGRSGTGLGLAVVWGTVKDHNGYIDVQSEEGKGTNFSLYFPVTREEAGKVKKAMSSDYYMSKGESILVVDDIKEQRELAMNILERLGYRVTAVAGGEEAIKYIKSKKADLIILDMIMDPGIDGYETYHRIREINPRQKAIIVSGFSETDRVRKVQEMGAGEFVRKPYTMEKIGLGIRKELDRK